MKPTDEALYDISEAVIALRRALMRHGFKAPAMIVLADHREGEKLMSLRFPQHWGPPVEMTTPEPVEAVDLPVQMKVEICGVQIRYPAHRISETGGGFRYV